nr:hypothetical protein GCM10025699_30290 [Microbacterium flavescens]
MVQRNVARVAKSVGRDAAMNVHRSSAIAYLQTARGPFDLVFIDPPYDLAEHELTHALELLVPLLSPHAVVVVERAKRSPEPTLPAGLIADRMKRYGDTALWWSRPAEPSAD